jgi:integrase
MAKMKGVKCQKRNGTEYWYAALGGKSPQYCGKGNKGRKLAETARKKFEVKKYEHREVAAGIKVKKEAFKTVNELANWYMTLPSIQKQKSFIRKTNACKHLLSYFGKRPVGQVEADDQEHYRERRKRQGAADGTVDLEINVLGAMYNLARKRKKIHAESMPGEFVLARKNNPRRTITDEEFETLLPHADKDFQDVLICGYESGMRSGEIANLRAYQVNLYEVKSEVPKIVVSYIDLGIFDTKTGASRTVPVSLRLKEVLERRLQGLEAEDHVFTAAHRNNLSKVGPYEGTRISRKMMFACERAGIPYGDKLLNEKGERIGVVFHSLRHTRTTKWVEAGFSDEIIRRATGHKSLDAYRNYVKLDPSAVMRLVEVEGKELNTDFQKPDKTGYKSQNRQDTVEAKYLKPKIM